MRELERRLQDAGIDYVVVGGLALNAFNDPRQTVDVDIVLTTEGYERFQRELVGRVYTPEGRLPRRFVDPRTEVTVAVQIAGQLAGRTSKNPSVRFPMPQVAEVHEDLRTVLLTRLIELKLVTWRYKDWGDVVELIRRNNLSESITDQLGPVVRSAFKKCYDQAHDEEYDAPSAEGG